MNKAELVEKIAKSTDLRKKDTETIINAFIATVKEELANKGKVAYKNKKSVKDLVKDGSTVKLYAVWARK